MPRAWRVLFLLAAVAALGGCVSPAPIVVVPPPTPEPSVAPTPAPIRVYVSGAVASPGVYRLPPQSLGEDALKAAGGPLPEADLEHVNLAQELRDQDHFHVPRKAEPGAAGGQATPAPTAGTRVNINTATVQELDRLPHIGPVTAQQIVDYRNRHGPFRRIEDILQVKGIGQATFDQIKDLITVGE